MRAAGLTMIELVFVIAVMAILAALALPSFNARLERQRLHGAAETLSADLAEARFESARRGQALFVEASVGEKAWCWAVTTQTGCDCAQAQACQLRNAQSKAYSGIKLLEPKPVRLDPAGTTETITVASFESRRGERLRVDLQALGRVRICTAAGPDTRYPHC
jgi:type IV fimbrial biogenesis protein FimT